MKSELLPSNALSRAHDLKRMGKDAASAVMIGFVIVALMGPVTADAQSVAGLPWVEFTKTLACQMQGSWVKWLAVIAIALGGIMFGLGELSGPFQRTMQIAGGFSIAVGAISVASLILPNSTSVGSCPTAMNEFSHFVVAIV